MDGTGSRRVLAAEATYQEMLGLSRELGDDGNIATALNCLATSAAQQEDFDRAKSLLEENLSVLRRLEDERKDPATLKKYHALALLGYLAINEHDYGRGIVLWEESLVLARKVGDCFRIGQNLSNLGYAALLQDDHERATECCEESLALVRALGSAGEILMSESWINLGLAALGQGDHGKAKSSFEEALVLSQKLGKKPTIMNALEGMATLAGALGEDDRAARLQGAAEAAREATGIALPPAERALHESHLSAVHSRLGTRWEEVMSEGRAMSLEEATRYALAAEETDPSEAPALQGRPTTDLTRREETVAVLVARGLTNHQISEELSISERTAANHVARILSKLSLSSRTQVASWAARRHPPASDRE